VAKVANIYLDGVEDIENIFHGQGIFEHQKNSENPSGTEDWEEKKARFH
jgi:hypothetical protein